jgi:hypothetical protein
MTLSQNVLLTPTPEEEGGGRRGKKGGEGGGRRGKKEGGEGGGRRRGEKEGEEGKRGRNTCVGASVESVIIKVCCSVVTLSFLQPMTTAYEGPVCMALCVFPCVYKTTQTI